MAVNFTKNQDEITKAWRNVVESTQEQHWALFGYEGSTNIIRLMSTGSNGLDELVHEFNCSLIQYAFCRVINNQVGLNKLVLINWQGESAPLSRKGLCASHVGDVANYFKGCALTITIRNDDEATTEHLMEQIMKSSASKINLPRQSQLPNESISDQQSSVKNSSSSGHKTNVASDLAANRKSFWQKQEEEEKERLAEEKRRAAEKQAQFERERKKREESEARKLAETIQQRDRLIDATRQADRKASINNSVTSSTGSSSQPSSIISSSGPVPHAGDDDGRVGRRSELIRLERNQETQSLISKGLIKNKRAIFEQQAAQAQQQQPQTTLTRRTSGAMITQRLNAFKSHDVSATSDVSPSPVSKTVVDKLNNGFAKKVSVSENESEMSTSDVKPIKREVQAVNLTNDEDETLSNVSYNNGNIQVNDSHVVDGSAQERSPKVDKQEIISDSPMRTNVPDTPSQDVNGNSKHSSPALKQSSEESTTNACEISSDELMFNGKPSEAIALYDYEAADNTEISFDPDDKIGFIQKVDPGWWQGKVMSGRFKGQIGLFPSNYVKEL